MDDYPELGTPVVAEGVGMVKGDLLRGGDGQIARDVRVRCTQTWGCARLGAGREAPGPALATRPRARDRTLPCWLQLSTTETKPAEAAGLAVHCSRLPPGDVAGKAEHNLTSIDFSRRTSETEPKFSR